MNKLFKKVLPILILFLFFSCNPEDIESPGEYLIFGHFYGFCIGDQCIQIYKLEDNKLFRDMKKEYPRHNRFYDASFVEMDNKYYERVRDLKNYFPGQVLTEQDTIFGCPDCADGGGLYIEYKTKDIHGYWIIDQNLRQIPAYLHEFVEQVNDKIEEINLIDNQ